jgi:hypothetical protein
MATAQLQLIHTDHAWNLDRRTVEIGRAGRAQARAALAAATADRATADRADDDGPQQPDNHTGHRAAA